MDGTTVLERDHSEGATAQLRQYSPESNTVIVLWFNSNGTADGPDTHLAGKVRPFSEHFVLEVAGKAKAVHDTFAQSTFARCATGGSSPSSRQRRGGGFHSTRRCALED